MAITTHLAVRSIVRSDKRRSFCLGSCKLVFRTVVMFSAWTVEFSIRPVSPGDKEICVGSRGGVVESGTTKTVVARGWLLRASSETTTTGRPPLSGGSLGNFTYNISPRCGGLGSWVSMPLSELCFRKRAPALFLRYFFIGQRVVVGSDLLSQSRRCPLADYLFNSGCKRSHFSFIFVALKNIDHVLRERKRARLFFGCGFGRHIHLINCLTYYSIIYNLMIMKCPIILIIYKLTTMPLCELIEAEKRRSGVQRILQITSGR